MLQNHNCVRVVKRSGLGYNIRMPRKNSKDLIAIAIYQLMAKIPYHKITVKLICEKAGVSRMSFYRYYTTKEDIFVNFSDERFAEFYELYMQGKDISMESFTKNVIHYFKKYSRQIKVLEKADKMSILITQFERYVSYLMKNLKNIEFYNYRDNPLAVPYYAGGLFNVLVYWCKHNFEETEEEMAHYLSDMFSKKPLLNA